MNKRLMAQYVEFVADSLSLGLISKTIYGTPNPFTWMNLISMEGKTNFFEKKVSAYGRQATLVNQAENTVMFDADF
jgi:ribonucleotide reductase beta subunit family protein with ferritin-like domain